MSDYIFPPKILIDKREQIPFGFEGIKADVGDGGQKVIVTTEQSNLLTGDYTLEGFENEIVIERKSKADLYRSITHERERFARELSRMNAIPQAFIVLETSFGGLLERPEFTKADPKTILRTIYSWKMKYQGVQWLPFDNRRFAEVQTFRILRMFWGNMEKKNKKSKCDNPATVDPDYTPDEIQFMMAANRLLVKLKRYPTNREILKLIYGLGWRKREGKELEEWMKEQKNNEANQKRTKRRSNSN